MQEICHKLCKARTMQSKLTETPPILVTITCTMDLIIIRRNMEQMSMEMAVLQGKIGKTIIIIK